MIAEEPFPAWLVTIAVIAVAVAFLVVDPLGLTSGFAMRELAAFQGLLPLGLVHAVNSIPAQVLLLETVGAALAMLIAIRQLLWTIVVALAAGILIQIASLLIYARLHVFFDTANAGAWLLICALCGTVVQALIGDKPVRRLVAETRSAPTLMPAPTAPQTDAAIPPPPATGPETMTTLVCALHRLPALAHGFGADLAGFVGLIETAIAALVEDAASAGAALSAFDGASFAAHWRAGAGDDHADQACEAAGRMLATLGRINDALVQKWPAGDTPCPVLDAGIGIATGPVLAGDVRTRAGRTTLAVPEGGPLPEHLAALAPRYGAGALLSEETCAAARRGFACLEVDFRTLEPGTAPGRLYALQGNALVRASPKFRAIETFHGRIFEAIAAREWEKARALIEQAKKLSGASAAVYDIQLARIAWYETNPPPPEWDGAFRPPLA